jgi:hypothetical protein
VGPVTRGLTSTRRANLDDCPPSESSARDINIDINNGEKKGMVTRMTLTCRAGATMSGEGSTHAWRDSSDASMTLR